MTAIVLRADAAHLPLPDASVDLIVTSPPYFALRSYQDGGQHYAHQIGSEPTRQEFLEALWACTAEWMRVLKPAGSIFVNLGDKYVADNRGSGSDYKRGEAKYAPVGPAGFPGRTMARQKSLMLLPERYRIGCVDRLGLIARSVIIWDKVNGLPESVQDRVRRSHEDWVHLTKQPRYFSAVDEIREPHARQWGGSPNGGGTYAQMKAPGAKDANLPHALPNSLGKLPNSVWSIESGSWAGPIDFCPRCGRDLRAGNGRQDSTATVTECSTSPRTARTDERIDSPTSYGSDQSPKVPNSITSAETGSVSDPTILNLSPSDRTSSEATPSQLPTSQRLTAPRATSTAPRTPTSDDGDTGSASCVCETVLASSGPGSVWSIATEPLNVPDHLGVDHFAAFPTEWPLRLIRGWSPAGICNTCGEGRRPVSDTSRVQSASSVQGARDRLAAAGGAITGGTEQSTLRGITSTTITGYACACPTPDAPTRPATVLDPFGGTGTTSLCASVLGRIGISVDLSHDYSRLAQWRTSDQDSRAKTIAKWHRNDKKRGISRPPVVDPLAPPEPQPYTPPAPLTLFDDEGVA